MDEKGYAKFQKGIKKQKANTTLLKGWLIKNHPEETLAISTARSIEGFFAYAEKEVCKNED